MHKETEHLNIESIAMRYAEQILRGDYKVAGEIISEIADLTTRSAVVMEFYGRAVDKGDADTAIHIIEHIDIGTIITGHPDVDALRRVKAQLDRDNPRRL